MDWEQHAAGGCRCVCRLYHAAPGACLNPAEPGYLIRIVVPAQAWGHTDISDPLPVCASCYTAVAPLADRNS
ncbi:DUF6372 family protein [Kribbella sp. NPDC023972]|uniref:DUF6372 family protein n=1 Tax=Kribbella sp. NPDC023972 TaxID=3154795 RepID=UPI0033F7A33C